jgi:hypothetical protein
MRLEIEPKANKMKSELKLMTFRSFFLPSRLWWPCHIIINQPFFLYRSLFFTSKERKKTTENVFELFLC